ncbi:MAG: hypothetical protein R3336_09380, partial [Phycisphaeraceae bacterium]|nr:hypothetical protein [Phycisphaeraceae bacterium]
MADLTHGSDLRLAPAIGPLVRSGLSVRQALDRVRAAGFEAITLDGTVRDLRARHLSRQARRDVSATLRRANLEPAGLDLFIPRPEFLQADTVDRALAATLDAIELAADLGNLPVHLALPVDNLGSQVREALLGRADTCGVTLGVHAEDALDPLEEWIRDSAAAHLGIGLDPAALL